MGFNLKRASVSTQPLLGVATEQPRMISRVADGKDTGNRIG